MSEEQNEGKDRAPTDLRQLYTALAKAQGAFKPIVCDRTVEVKPRDPSKRGYIYTYATLGAVLAACREALSVNGLSFTAPYDGEWLHVCLDHSAGGHIESKAKLVPRGDWQAFASDITYARRILGSALLGVASEFDDDGNTGAGNDFAASDRGNRKPDPWERLLAAGVPTEAAALRAWCERVLGRPLTTEDSIRDVDMVELLDVAEKRKPMPPGRPKMCTEDQASALNKAVNALAPWGSKGLDGMTKEQADAKKKNAKLAWASSMLQPKRRVTSFAQLTEAECAKLLTAASNGEMPADDPLPAWMEGEKKA
jgi:hypothetical protein